MPWNEVELRFARYLLTSGRGKRTAITYAYNVRFFWQAMDTVAVYAPQATSEEVKEWLRTRSHEVSANKIYVDIMALRAFYTFVVQQKWRKDDPMDGIKARKEKLAPVAPFNEGEIAALVAACGSERDRLILLMLASTGLRISELLALRVEDIDWQRGMVLIHGKGNHQRWMAPNAEVMARLHIFLRNVHQGHIWFTNQGHVMPAKQARENLYAAARRAGIIGAHPHRFRTTFAIEMLRIAGGDIQAVQDLLGHESIETTQRYTAYDKADRALNLMRRYGELRAG